MTAARIKALRYFLRASPGELALHAGISINDVTVLECGLLTPNETQVESLKVVEHNLSLHGSRLMKGRGGIDNGMRLYLR